MLTQLDIHGMAIIDHLSVSFGAGFNVLTGETGAGKSILIKALHLLLGAKAAPEIVRQGHEQAIISGSFHLAQGHAVLQLLEHLGIPTPGEGHGHGLLLRRVVQAKGRTAAWANDIPITVATLKEIGSRLIDIFAQHDNQKLLDEATHGEQLDAFLPPSSESKANYTSLYQQASLTLHSLRQTLAAYRQKSQGLDTLEQQHSDLAALNPGREDYEGLRRVCAEAAQSLQKKEKLLHVAQLLDSAYGGEALSQALWQGGKILERLEGQGPALAKQMEDLATGVDDLSFELERALEAIDLDEQQLDMAQERLATYQSYCRKFLCEGIDGLLAEQERIERELHFIRSATKTISQQLANLDKLCQGLQAKAAELAEERRAAALILEKRVAAECQELAMPATQLWVHFEAVKSNVAALDFAALGNDFAAAHAATAARSLAVLSRLREDGSERIRFLLSTNAGESPKALSRVASGGEVSRLILALKRALLSSNETAILVFDEIDTGISGRIAAIVGKKLWEMAQKTQILCISHLAQVAAYAEHHYSVRKTANSATSTVVSLHTLSPEETTEEIARLLSGAEVTPLSLANAKHLLEGAKPGKESPRETAQRAP